MTKHTPNTAHFLGRTISVGSDLDSILVVQDSVSVPLFHFGFFRSLLLDEIFDEIFLDLTITIHADHFLRYAERHQPVLAFQMTTYALLVRRELMRAKRKKKGNERHR